MSRGLKARFCLFCWKLGDLTLEFFGGLEFRRSFMGTLPVPVWWDPYSTVVEGLGGFRFGC